MRLFGKGNMLLASRFLSDFEALDFEESLLRTHGGTGFHLREHDSLLAEAKRQLLEYFSRQRKVFTIPLPTPDTSFTSKALALVREVPYGTTCSYKSLALRLNTGAVRAVGTAMGKNPHAIFVPAHRIIPASGKLANTHKSDTKLALLQLEGVSL